MTKISDFTVDAPQKANISFPVFDPNEALPADQNKRMLYGDVKGYIPVLQASLPTLISTSGLVAGAKYKITDIADAGVILEATTDNQVASAGIGLFYNCDYQNIGDYSGVAAVTTIAAGSRSGVWDTSVDASISTGQITIWNSRHYQCISSASVDGTDPETNTTAYAVLPKQTNCGYFLVADAIVYDVNDNYIVGRIDERGNACLSPNYAFFQWGNENVNNNIVDSKATLSCRNNKGTIRSNSFSNECVVVIDNSNKGTVEKNLFAKGNFTISCPSAEFFKSNTLDNPGTFTIGKAYDSKILTKDYSSFDETLDMSDTGVFDTELLTISADLNFIGVFTLINNTGQTISKISGLPGFNSVRFLVENGNSQTFHHNTIAAAGATNILYNGNDVDTLVTGRTDTPDWIDIKLSGDYNTRVYYNILKQS